MGWEGSGGERRRREGKEEGGKEQKGECFAKSGSETRVCVCVCLCARARACARVRACARTCLRERARGPQGSMHGSRAPAVLRYAIAPLPVGQAGLVSASMHGLRPSSIMTLLFEGQNFRSKLRRGLASPRRIITSKVFVCNIFGITGKGGSSTDLIVWAYVHISTPGVAPAQGGRHAFGRHLRRSA